jgi:hypothetical protein
MPTTRTVGKYVRFLIKDSGAVLREIPVDKIGDVGLTYPEVELTAIQDAVQGFLAGLPGFSLEIEGPLDNSSAVAAAGSGAAPTLSGSHTVLNPVNGLTTPLSLGIYIGMGRYWTTGDPVFGLSSSSTNGVIVTSYVMQGLGTQDPARYKAKIAMYPGSAAPAWGTAAIT